jgi:hypothetical protein
MIQVHFYFSMLRNLKQNKKLMKKNLAVTIEVKRIINKKKTD